MSILPPYINIYIALCQEGLEAHEVFGNVTKTHAICYLKRFFLPKTLAVLNKFAIFAEIFANSCLPPTTFSTLMTSNNIKLITTYYAANMMELRAYTNKILNDEEEAKDVVQECFVRLVALQQPILPATLPAMVHNMVRNMAVSMVRRRAIVREYQKVQSAASLRSAEHLEARIVASDLMALLAERIAALPADCRTIYEMNLYDGIKVSEIAQRLNVKYKYAEKKLGKARREVRKALRNVG